MKKIFIIPGFKQKATDKQFAWLRKFLIAKGFTVALVPITWERRTMIDYTLEFKAFYEKHKAKDNYVLGFSYGAVIAFITANKLKPKKIYLCSLSPDFKEDVSDMKPWIARYVGKNRIADSLQRSGKEIAKNLVVQAVVLYGEEEGRQYPKLKIRCEETARLAKNAKIVVVKKSSHNIAHPEYTAAIKAQF
ncbi:hypothetical protein A2Z10_00875 [Candidatus Azambacteria bacterium RBG_16_47_10]|uniref:Alpha/beta hydrolase n=1 Tax=Candidatus Azambacteria bacterium RBG_16_47_10 TaxID=1797292 RepID=A0A1F5B089_9BACT|nr:MAG: hypothetical protein A2Z10_00875 [Candidatus Azambacteria bacterium RBG_16_47_10]